MEIDSGARFLVSVYCVSNGRIILIVNQRSSNL